MEKVKRIAKVESVMQRKLDRSSQKSPLKYRRFTTVSDEDNMGHFFTSQKHSGM